MITTIQNMGKRLKENEKMIYSLNSSLEGANAKNNKFMEEINLLNELIAKIIEMFICFRKNSVQ